MDEPGGYLFRTAMNVFRNRYRRAAIALRRVTHIAPEEDALADVEERDAIVRALRALTPIQRAAVVMTTYGGLSSEETGRVLGIRPTTVRTHAARARTAMRESMGDRT